ncbi:MAG: GNAT family N-acetyltransferase [Desulfomonilia bacterium]|nr:GNAT family N-acetyltransferase [Desulfomonilia bacterium]
MAFGDTARRIDELKRLYPEKFLSQEEIFSNIHRGDRIFVGTGCAEPQYLVKQFTDYARQNPKAFFDAELSHLHTFGVAYPSYNTFRPNYRQNVFFIADNTRDAINQGLMDYTPIFLSQIPALFARKLIPIDVALIQTSPPDEHGRLSLGIGVDITKAAVKHCSVVIAQINAHMPYIHGDGLIEVDDIDFFVHRDEPLLEYEAQDPGEIAQRIGRYVAKIISDGSTIQVGYGGIPNAILANLKDKNHLGIHTELFTTGIARLMKEGVVDNTRKSLDTGKTVAALCLASGETYEFLHDNPSVMFMPIDYTNNPQVIIQQANMVAINSALEVDLTGQATAESLGELFYSGIGGQADFMRGVAAAPNGKTILALQSTARNGTVSRIVPFLNRGAGVTLNRGDIHYVVTEYGICYLHGKNIRERAMSLISIAHPHFRPWLIEEAKKHHLIFQDQAFYPGEQGEYPYDLETHRTTRSGQTVLFRPIKISDEPLLKDFVYSLSDQSMYKRFLSPRTEIPHQELQKYVVIDYTRQMAIMVILEQEEKEEVIGVARWAIEENLHTAALAIVIRDDFHGQGIGYELLSYMTYLAQKQGLLGFSSEILADNRPVLRLVNKFRERGFQVTRSICEGVLSVNIMFSSQG